MLRSRLFLSLSAAIVLAVITVFARQTPPARDIVVVDPESEHFGEVWEDAAFPWKVRVTNRTNSEVLLTNAIAECRCTSLSPEQFSLPPRASSEVSVTLDLSKGAVFAADGKKEFITKFQYTIPIQRGIVPVTLHGTVKKWPAESLPHSVIIPDYFVEHQPPLAVAEILVSPLVARLDVERFTNTLQLAQVVRDEINPRRWWLQIKALDQLPPGHINAECTLRATMKEGRSPPHLRIPVEGFVHGCFSLTPGTLVLGRVPPHQKIESTISITRTGALPFAVIGVEADSANIDIDWTAESRDCLQLVTMHLSPIGQGDQRTSLRIVLQDSESETPTIVRLPVTWYGLVRTRIN